MENRKEIKRFVDHMNRFLNFEFRNITHILAQNEKKYGSSLQIYQLRQNAVFVLSANQFSDHI